MRETFFFSLIQNIAILLTFSMLYDYFWERVNASRNILYQLITGLFVGMVGIILILTPWTFREGIFFDTRSVLLSVSGLFLGTIPTVIAMIILLIYRLIIGGAGIWMGVAVIISSGTIGLFWSFFRKKQLKSRPLTELIFLGIAVHLAMLISTLMVRAEFRQEMLDNIIFPVLIVYPVANMLLGLLMLHQKKNSDNRKALVISEQRWHFAIEGSGDGLWDWDIQTNEVFFSAQWKKMLGYEDDEIPNVLDSWKKLLHEDDKERVYKEIDRLLCGDLDIYEVEQRLLCKDGSYKWILDRGKIMIWTEEGRPLRCVGTHRDITESKKARESMKFYQEKLNNFASHLQVAREEERLMLAKEIHDELGQMLISAKIELGLLRQKIIRELPEDASAEIIQDFESLQKKIKSAINASRKIMTDLRTEVLHLLGLEDAIRSYVKQFETRYNIRCSLTIQSEDLKINTHQTVAVYRIFQEAMTNIASHANANEVKITLYAHERELYLEIADNGKGIAENDVFRENAYGIISIRERVAFLKGKLDITGHRGTGTTLKVQFRY